jgi:4-amino-4-deoxy-L-arabinose transferase-like glycosyltransferase/membrane-associated phospholipid phosphatase
MDFIRKPEAEPSDKRPPFRRLKYFWLYLLIFATAVTSAVVVPFDQSLSDRFRLLQGSRGFPIFFLHLAELMKYFGRGDVLLLLGCVLALHRIKKAVVLACLALLITIPMVSLGKIVFERERPDRSTLRSFPSGDAAAISSFLVPLAALHPAVKPVAIASVIVVGAERIILGKHFPSDVFAGLAIGLFAGAVVLSFRFLNHSKTRRVIRRKWLGVVLGLALLIAFFLGVPASLKRFLNIFGPGVALLIVVPFIRPWLRALKRADDVLPKNRKQMMVAGAMVLLMALLLYSSSSSTLWNREEVRLSRTTLEMVHSKNYLAPTLDGQPSEDKAMLVYWLMSIPVRIFGQTEVAYRFLASISIVCVSFLTFRLGLQLYGWSTGFLAMLILATTPLLFLEGSVATTDAMRLALVVAAYFIFELGLKNGVKWTYCIGWMFVTGACILTGGPSCLILPMLGMVVTLILARKLSFAWGTVLFSGVLFALFTVLFWTIPATPTHGSRSLLQGLVPSVREFFLTVTVAGWKDNLQLLSFFIPVMLLSFFPWTLLLPAGVFTVLSGRVGNGVSRFFLLGWMISAFILASLFSMKLPHPILPIMPVLALATARVIHLAEHGELGERDLIWLGRGRWIFGAIGFLGSLILIMGVGFARPFGLKLPGFEPTGKCWSSSIAMGSVFLVTTIFVLREQAAKRYRSTVGILVAGCLGIILTLTLIVFPPLEVFKFPKRLAATIYGPIPAEVQVAAMNYKEPSLFFYFPGRPIHLIENQEGVTAWAQEARPGLIILPRNDLRQIKSKEGLQGLQEIGALQGFDYATKRWMELVVLGRNLR